MHNPCHILHKINCEKMVVDCYCKFIVQIEKEGVEEEGTLLWQSVLFWRE